jgi:hypothetical protein
MAKKTPMPPVPVSMPREVRAGDPENRKGKLRIVGGSLSDNWNLILANQVTGALWLGNSDSDMIDRQLEATVAALEGIAPRNEMEAMAAAQMIAAHNAAVECLRRAMLPEQTLEGRSVNLSQANKLSRTYSTLWEALYKARGKGKQRVTVKHVHVHAGGQAVVGVVNPGGGGSDKIEDQSHAKQIAHAPEPALRSSSADPGREALPVARDGERTLPDARRQ